MSKKQKQEEKTQNEMLVDVLMIKGEEISKSLKSAEASFDFWKRKVAQAKSELQAVNILIEKYQLPF